MGLPPPPHSPRQRRFSFSSRLKRRGDAPRGRSGRRAGPFQVPGPGLASAGLRPERRREHLPWCADSPRPEWVWTGPGPPLVHRPLCPLATREPPPRPLPGSTSPQAVPRAGPQRRSYLPRGLSISVPFHPHDPALRQEESCPVIVFTVSFPNSRILWAFYWSRGTLPSPRAPRATPGP